MSVMGDNAPDLTFTISTVMGEVLSRAPLGPHDDFFLCGGDSLLAVQLISRLSTRLGPGDEESAEQLRSTLLMAVFDEATPVALAAAVDTGS